MIICGGGWMPHNLSEGWRRIGFSVEEFFYGTHMGKSWSNAGREENKCINEQLLLVAKRLKAEGHLTLIFSVIYDDVLSIETARKLRALGVPMVNYHVDLIGQWYRVLRTGKYFDYLACAQEDHWQGLRRAGIRPLLLPMAANPPTPNSVSGPDRTYNGVLYLGSPWLYRRAVLAELAREGLPLRIYGRNWHRRTPDPANAQPWRKALHDMRHYLLPRLRDDNGSELGATVRNRLRRVTPSAEGAVNLPPECVHGSYASTEFVPLVRGAAMNLGFTHFLGEPGTAAERRQVRLRDFEIPMAGGFYLAQDCNQLRKLFQVGKHVETWDKLPELKEKVRYYIEHPGEGRRIASAGQSHCLRYHTWASRFAELLGALKLPLPEERSAAPV